MKSFQEIFRIKSILTQNKILFWTGTIHLVIFFFLLLYMPFNNIVVLGLNSVAKPMKFALSIWIYSWTMAIILHPINKKTKVKIYSWVAVTAMSFEQIAITIQALRGELSHFNSTDTFGFVVFQLMGIFILTLTIWTSYMAYVFIKQKTYHIPPALVLSIKLGLIFFVIFSLFGGYIGGKTGHTVGALDGGKGLWFLNWSTLFGDLRVAHFFGIHSLQIIPLFALSINKFLKTSSAIKVVWLFSILYFLYVTYTMLQSILGKPFISL